MEVKSLALFIAVTLMLIYRTIDLFCIQEKLNQLFEKHSWMTDEVGFKKKRNFLCSSKRKSKNIFIIIGGLNLLYKEFILILMSIYIVILMIVGYSALLAGNNSSTPTIVVALSTTFVSLFGSFSNLFIEKIKTHI